MAFTTRDRIPLRVGGCRGGDDEDCCCSFVVGVLLWEYLVGSNVTTPPDCAPLIMVTLTFFDDDVGVHDCSIKNMTLLFKD